MLSSVSQHRQNAKTRQKALLEIGHVHTNVLHWCALPHGAASFYRSVLHVSTLHSTTAHCNALMCGDLNKSVILLHFK